MGPVYTACSKHKQEISVVDSILFTLHTGMRFSILAVVYGRMTINNDIFVVSWRQGKKHKINLHRKLYKECTLDRGTFL